MGVTISDVARMAGVSPMTVSNVINDSRPVSERLRKRVLAAIDSTGYTPNGPARQLKYGYSDLVGVVTVDPYNPFYGELAHGVSDVVEQRDIMSMVMSSRGDAAREARLLRMLDSQRVQGVVLASLVSYDERADDLQPFLARGAGLVCVGDEESASGFSTVCVDEDAVGELAGLHLAARGHRRIAYLGGDLGVPVYRKRLEALEKGLAAGGVSASVVHVAIDDSSLEGGYAAGMRLFDLPSRPTAAFCANDLLALGLLRAASEMGVQVPRDLAIVGVDDIPFAQGASVPLTSVRQPAREMGEAAAAMLLAQVGGDTTPQHVKLRPTLSVRRSTMPG